MPSSTSIIPRVFRKNPRGPSGLDTGQSDPALVASQAVPPSPFGVEVLHDCPDATVDICFVHGLVGDRRSSWTAPGQSAPWPQTLLPPMLDKARILTYGYDAHVVRGSVASSNRLADHAANLVQDLMGDRARCSASSRPLVFVAHSLGGLVCKEAILLSRSSHRADLQDVFAHTTGVIFLGTPHRGARMARWVKIPASVLGLVMPANKLLLEVLETDNQYLESIQARFGSMINELQGDARRRIKITSFSEEQGLGIFGHIVSRESATFDYHGNHYTIPANHRGMARFGSAEDVGFKRVLYELKAQIGREIQAVSGTNCPPRQHSMALG